MDYSLLSPANWIPFLSLVAAVVAFAVASGRPSTEKVSRASMIISVLPSLLMLGLFYSLVFHMHQTLGRMPNIKEPDTSSSFLNIHAAVTQFYFAALVLGSLLVWPVAFVLCLFIGPWRNRISYLGVYAAAFLVCFLAVQHLAPAQFLEWWWD